MTQEVVTRVAPRGGTQDMGAGEIVALESDQGDRAAVWWGITPTRAGERVD